MSISIYTYSNPYKLNREPYWASIKNCFQLCVSQTMVNGMCSRYEDFYNGKLTTITNLVNNLFEEWNSPITAIEQHAAIDNAIETIDIREFCKIKNESSEEETELRTSLKKNRADLYKSVRTMFEMNISENEVVVDKITREQRILLKIYKYLIDSKIKVFRIPDKFSEIQINAAIEKTIKENTAEENIIKTAAIDKSCVVIHGIHQFTPLILKTIETLSTYKRVVLIFNYIPEFANIYETWNEIYRTFESRTVKSQYDFLPDLSLSKGGEIASSIGGLIEENSVFKINDSKIEIVEYNNLTEFVGYISAMFENAKKKAAKDENKHPILYYMDEQIYSASPDPNDLLKIYFPDQFGERNFLDYPIGHFFIAVTNMWDPDSGNIIIKDINDIYECLSCGILSESRTGLLATTFNETLYFFSNEETIDGIIKQLKKLKRYTFNIEEGEHPELQKISAYNVETENINALIDSLYELKEIISYFYDDFNDKNNNFKSFYEKIELVLKQKVLSSEELDRDFLIVTKRVLKRLEETKEIEANASFDCLKDTMKLFLTQDENEKRGARWIVKNFEQIDGDVIRETSRENKAYHFSCLSDADMSTTTKEEFDWPLNEDFFLSNLDPIDWKCQTYVVSKMEYKNFKRYALIYGLIFSNANIKLSFIKEKDGKESQLYYLLRFLSPVINRYQTTIEPKYFKRIKDTNLDGDYRKRYDYLDYIRYLACPHKFYLDSIISERSIIRDDFSIQQYIQIVLETDVLKEFAGKTFIKPSLETYLDDRIDELRKFIPSINNSRWLDVRKTVIKYVEKYGQKNNKYYYFTDSIKDRMNRRLEFLASDRSINDGEVLQPRNSDEINQFLKEKIEGLSVGKKELSSFCETCSDRYICLKPFTVRNRRRKQI